MNEKDTLLSQLDVICKELIVNQGVKHKHIITHIHDTLVKEAANLPKIQVLYNNAYGGFEYSRHFRDFVHQSSSSCDVYDDKTRVSCVKYIIPFAKLYLEKYPYIKDLLYLYEHYKLSKVIDIVVSVVHNKQYITKLRNRIDVYDELLNNKKYHGDEVVNDDIIDRDPPKKDLIGCPAYKYLHFISLTQEKISRTQSIIEKNITKGSSLIGHDVFDDMTSIVRQIVDDDGLYPKVSPSHPSTFLKAVEKFGEQDYKIWIKNSKFNEKVMRYLLIKKKDVEQLPEAKDGMIYDFLITHDYLPIDHSVYDSMVNKFGLQCASGLYCSLVIGEVPALVDWKIEEYDGQETLIIL